MSTPSQPLPVHLQELLELLEAQTEPDRRGAILAIEKKHGVHIELDEALEFDEFAARYARWTSRIEMALKDKSVTNGLKGTASASAVARAIGALGGPARRGDTDNGRVALGRPSRERAAAHRRRW